MSDHENYERDYEMAAEAGQFEHDFEDLDDEYPDDDSGGDAVEADIDPALLAADPAVLIHVLAAEELRAAGEGTLPDAEDNRPRRHFDR